MQIIVNGKPAYIKKGSSFQFVAENRHFTGSDSYSLSITFPLKGCSENIAIFGNIHRTDVEREQVNFDCTIIDRKFRREGIITITSISDSEVKTQFLEGRSVQNYDIKFDEIYINELQLGSYSPTLTSSPYDSWRGIDRSQNYVALPWVNNSSGNVQNKLYKASTSADWQWDSEVKGLSYQPYLVYIIRLICIRLEYEVDISEIENSPYKYLIICNALPYAWENYYWESVLPHWTVTEFFEQLGYLLGGDFSIDHKAHSIVFRFIRSEQEKIQPCRIDKVVDSYSADVSQDNACKYIEQVGLRYADCDHQAWKSYVCDWFISENRRSVKEFPDMGEFEYYLYQYMDDSDDRGGYWYERSGCVRAMNYIFYVKDVDTYFVARCFYCRKRTGDFTWWQQEYVVMPINVFRERKSRNENGETIELKCVPVWLDNVEGYNWGIYLDLPEFDASASEENYERTNDNNGWNPSGQQVPVVNNLLAGERERKTEFFDKIYLGFWTGNALTTYLMPCPIIDYITVVGERTYHIKDMSLRLTNGYNKQQFYTLEENVKYTFSFLADDIPNPRALFYIKGQRYLCEKITATFTENGMSQLLKGVFYKVK